MQAPPTNRARVLKVPVPAVRFGNGCIVVSYDGSACSRSDAWDDLQDRFDFTFTTPTFYEDGTRNYEEANPWRRNHTHPGWCDNDGAELVSEWRWECPASIFATRCDTWHRTCARAAHIVQLYQGIAMSEVEPQEVDRRGLGAKLRDLAMRFWRSLGRRIQN